MGELFIRSDGSEVDRIGSELLRGIFESLGWTTSTTGVGWSNRKFMACLSLEATGPTRLLVFATSKENNDFEGEIEVDLADPECENKMRNWIGSLV